MTITENTVAVCMATYNGAKYVEEQIESICKQSYSDWVLFIRDDNSNDETVKIVKRYVEKYREKIVLIEDKKILGGSSKKNFAGILSWVSENYKFNYFMFSDQDDYWLPTKIETSIKRIKKLESEYDGPILVHTDLRVVDQKLQTLGESFVKYRALNASVKDINHLLVQNNITGCTMCWNEKLNRILNLSDDYVVMHDWWMALVASCFGKIEFIDEQTILYRQHGNNVVGATNVNSLSFIVQRLTGRAHVKETLVMSMDQAEAFATYYKNQLSSEQLNTIRKFAGLKKKCKFSKIVTVLQKKYLKQGIIQVIGELMFI